MHRELEIIRKILIDAKIQKGDTSKFYSLDKNSTKITAHVKILVDVGLLTHDDQEKEGTYKLTNCGYNFIACIENYHVWEEIRTFVKNHDHLSFPIVLDLAIKYIKDVRNLR